MQKEISALSSKLAKAFNTNTLISPLPKKFCKNTKNANLLRIASEKLIKSPIIGFKFMNHNSSYVNHKSS